MSDVEFVEEEILEDVEPEPIDPLSIPVRFSNLKWMRKSPAHYLYAISHERPDSAAMRIGRVVHRLLLGGPNRFFLYDKARKGKAWQTFKERHADADIITAEELRLAEDMARAVTENEEAKALLDVAGSTCEAEIKFEIAGRACTGRPDVVTEKSRRIVELKTSACAEPEWFARQSLRMGYFAQLAWYGDAVFGVKDVYEAAIVAVESKPPHVVTPMLVSSNALDVGRRTWRLWWERLRACEESGVWPGYVSGGLGYLDVAPDVDLTFGEDAA